MKIDRFEFVAGTSKDDMFIGLCLPAIIVLPTFATYLIIFYLGIATSFKNSHILIRLFAFVPALYLMYFLIKKLRKYISNKFVVYWDNLNIRICKNEKEIISGKALYCNIKVSNDKLVHIDIKTEQGSISFRARPKEYKTLTGKLSFNPFGTATESEMKSLLALGRKIQNTIEEQKNL